MNSSTFTVETYSSSDSPFPVPLVRDQIILVNDKTLLDFFDSRNRTNGTIERVESPLSGEFDDSIPSQKNCNT